MANIKILTNSLVEWYQEKIGQIIFSLEKEHLQKLTPTLLGNYFLQYGMIKQEWYTLHKSTKTIYLTQEKKQAQEALIQARFNELPFPDNYIDNIFLPHVLEFQKPSFEILKEAMRILVPEGHLIILAFNPASLWGIKNFFSQHKEPPWVKNRFSFNKINNYLYELHAEIISATSFVYSIPHTQTTSHKNSWREVFCRLLLPNNGSISLIVARKRVIPVTPIKPAWTTEFELSKEYVEPSAGRVTHDKIS